MTTPSNDSDPTAMRLPVMPMVDDVEPPPFLGGTAIAAPDIIGTRDDDQDNYEDGPAFARWEDAVGEAAHGDPIALPTDPYPGSSSKPGDGAWSVWIDQDGERPSPPAEPTRSRGGVTTVIAVAFALLLVAGVTTVLVINRQTSPSLSAAPVTPTLVKAGPDISASTSISPPTAWPNATANCTLTSTPQLSTGAGPGDTTSPAGVIHAFYWAYYVTRSAQDAYALLAPGTTLAKSTPGEFQEFIDADLPLGTRYCVAIRPDTAAGAWLIDLDEQFPGAPVAYYPRRFTTVIEGGRAYITSIASTT